MTSSIIPIQSNAAQRPLHGLALLRLGFRPFYLGAAFFGLVSIPIWVASFIGWIPFKPTVTPLLWHAHEMLFGFAVAVVIGFLLTAVKAWTGSQTPRGPALGALAVLWLAARLAALVGPYLLYAALDLALLPLVAVALVRVMVKAKNWRNLPLAFMLILMSLANLCFHAAVLGAVHISPLQPLFGCLALIVMMECVIAGRVVPAFMNNATPGLKATTRRKVELSTLAMTAWALALWLSAPTGSAVAVFLLTAAGLHIYRQWQWKPHAACNRPILWILHAAYLWIPLGLSLLALAQLGVVPASAGIHALGVGATGGLIIGMMTRTARGHTGRPLRATKPEVVAYGLVLLAAALRVMLPLASSRLVSVAVVSAGLAWAAAFAIYLVIFTPWLSRTRLDGKDG